MIPSYNSLKLSASKLLAYAFCRTFPRAQFVESFATGEGFSCDVLTEETLDAQALATLEEQMYALVRQELPISALEMMRENAAAFLLHQGYPVRAAQVEESSLQTVSIFRMGDFADLADPPFLSNSNEISYFKLLRAYPVETYLPGEGIISVTRIDGTICQSQKELKQHIKLIANARKHDHVKLGQELKLFILDELSGSCVWLPRGIDLRRQVRTAWEKTQHGVPLQELSTPALLPETKLPYKGKRVAPFNQMTLHDIPYLFGSSPLPAHISAFFSGEYRTEQCPIFYYEWYQECQDTPPGKLSGLYTPRVVFKDTTQIFCTPEQLLPQLISSLQFIYELLKMFGIHYSWWLIPGNPTKGEDKKQLEISVELLQEALNACGFSYTLDKQAKKRYGARVEARLVDALQRTWAGPYVEFATELCMRLSLQHEKWKGNTSRPSLISRSLLGSMELFTAILLEQTQGNFLKN